MPHTKWEKNTCAIGLNMLLSGKSPTVGSSGISHKSVFILCSLTFLWIQMTKIRGVVNTEKGYVMVTEHFRSPDKLDASKQYVFQNGQTEWRILAVLSLYKIWGMIYKQLNMSSHYIYDLGDYISSHWCGCFWNTVFSFSAHNSRKMLTNWSGFKEKSWQCLKNWETCFLLNDSMSWIYSAYWREG